MNVIRSIFLFWAIPFLAFCFSHNLAGQHLGGFVEVATSTNWALKNHRGIGLTYTKINNSGSSWQLGLSKGYSSFKDDQDDIFYGNRIFLSSVWQKRLTGNSRKGLYYGAGVGLETYYATILLTPSLNPVILLQLQYLETNVLRTPLSLFINVRPKASIGLEYITRCYDCFTPYAEPMLLLELNAGIMYNLSKKEKQIKNEE